MDLKKILKWQDNGQQTLSNMLNNDNNNTNNSMMTIESCTKEIYFPLTCDVWAYIISFISETKTLAALNCTSKNMYQYCTLSNPYLQLPQLGTDIELWVSKFKRIQSIDFYSNHFKFEPFSSIVERLMQQSKMINSISISKCFSIKNNIIQPLMRLCTELAICDITFNVQLAQNSFAHLHTLILNNCSIDYISILPLFRNIPQKMKLLALGGSKFINENDGTIDFSEEDVCLRSDLIIEETFISPNDKIILDKIFPHRIKIDLIKSSINDLNIYLLGMSPSIRSSGLLPALLSCCDSWRSTPLHISSKHGDMERVEWLIQNWSRLDLKDSKGCTALHRAIQGVGTSNTVGIPLRQLDREKSDHCYGCAIALIGANANVIIKNHAFESPLSMAASFGNIGLLEHMTKMWKMDPQRLPSIDDATRDDKSYTALHAAVISRNIDCCKLLLTLGCDPNRGNLYGTTPMHLVCKYQDPTLLDLFNAHGGDELLKDTYGDNGIDYQKTAMERKINSSQSHKSKKKSVQVNTNTI
jgi:ankyrin repeat protein